MSNDRHSFVAFYPSDWLGGTARMTRTQRSVYFDVCCFNWDKATECPVAELALMLGDIDGWQVIVDLLIAAGKLYRTPDGSVGNSKAIAEAKKALDLWQRRSNGGKRGACVTNAVTPARTADGTHAVTPGGTRPGVPSQNQNQNQNQKDTSSLRSDVCAEPSATAPPSKPDDSPPFIALETNIRGHPFVVSEAVVEQFRGIYPAVDVEQAFRGMQGWLIANPGKRKTSKGMLRFVNTWLSKEQDKGHRNGTNGGHHNAGGRASGSHQNFLAGGLLAMAGERGGFEDDPQSGDGETIAGEVGH